MLENNGESAREVDANGYVTIKDNPIIRAGVFQYKGSQLPGGEPDVIYNVYRPLEELTTPEAMQSFVGLPIFDEHEMVGERYARGAEERGAHGSVLENIYASGMDILAPIRIFSRTLKGLIDAGKRGLSLGYNCVFEKSSGAFGGIAYNYIQRKIRGNHLALVTQGRNGTAVLDSHYALDHFDLALDTGENKMADDKTEEKTEKAAMTLSEVHAFLTENAPMWQELQALMGAKADGETAALDGDTKEKEGEQKAEDADEKKEDKKEEKKEAMDSAAVNTAIESRLAAERKTITKSIMADVTARNTLAKSLEPHIGTFAFDHMDTAEVAAYGVEKLGIKSPKGSEAVAIQAYLAGLDKASSKTMFAMDTASTPQPKADGALSKRLAGAAA